MGSFAAFWTKDYAEKIDLSCGLTNGCFEEAEAAITQGYSDGTVLPALSNAERNSHVPQSAKLDYALYTAQDAYGKLMKSLAPTSPSSPSMHPHLIASGLGLASRKELAGLCALLETVSLAGVAIGVGADLLQRIGAEIETAAARVNCH